jgi:hypothetical protein
MGLVYVNEVPGIGEVLTQSTPITVIRGLLLTPPDFNFASGSAFALEANYLSAIAAGQMYPIPEILECNEMNFADKEIETSIGRKVFQFEGPRGWELKTVYTLEQHQKLREYSFKNWRAFYIDENNNIRGCKADGTKIQGFKFSYFRVQKQGSASAKDAAYSVITLQEAHVQEWDKKGVMVNPDWLAGDLVGVLDIIPTQGGNVAANSLTLNVNYVDDSQLTSAGAINTIPVSGLVAANVKILNGNTPVTPTVTESTSTPGTYTISATTLVAGYTLQIEASSTMLFKSDPITLT